MHLTCLCHCPRPFNAEKGLCLCVSHASNPIHCAPCGLCCERFLLSQLMLTAQTLWTVAKVLRCLLLAQHLMLNSSGQARTNLVVASSGTVPLGHFHVGSRMRCSKCLETGVALPMWLTWTGSSRTFRTSIVRNCVLHSLSSNLFGRLVWMILFDVLFRS